MRINVDKFKRKIQVMAILYPNMVPKAVVIGRPTMLPIEIPRRIFVM